MTTQRKFSSHWLPWVMLVAVLAVALVVGSGSGGQASLTERTRSVAETVRCPECTDKSMAASDAPTSVAGKKEIRRQLAAGKSADEVRAWFADRYGADVLLTPSRSGIEGLIWAIPVVTFIVAAAVLAAAFLRWKRTSSEAVSAEDRDKVAAALEDLHHGADQTNTP